MQFNETLNKTGLIQHCEMRLFGDDGYGKISGNTNRLQQFTDRINRALDRFVFLAMTADGRWQWDDRNHNDLSIATTDIESGKRNYEFALDHLVIESVQIKLPDGSWKVIKQFDYKDNNASSYLENNTGNTGTPTRYDKRGSMIILDVVPNFNQDEGLRVYFKRGADYFVYSDLTKKAGIPSMYYPYLSLHACTNYAIDRQISGLGKNLFELLQREEASIQQFFSERNKDEVRRLTVNYQNNK